MSSNFPAQPNQNPPSPSHTESTSGSWFHAPPTSTHKAYAGTSNSSHSQATSRSTSLSSLSSLSFPASPRVHINVNLPSSNTSMGFGAIGDKARAQQFGHGWKTGALGRGQEEDDQGIEVLGDMPHTPPMIADFLDPSGLTPIAPKRIRTPSLPILPSQAMLRGGVNNTTGMNTVPTGYQHRGTNHPYDHTLLGRFDQLSIGSYPYTPPSTADSFPSTHSAQYPFPPAPYGGLQTTPTRQPGLRNHQSVPNLDRSERRQGSVRFSDELESYEGIEPGTTGGMRSKSMSNLNIGCVGKKRNVYIHNLPSTVTETGLRAFAEAYGKVLSMRVAIDEVRNMGDRYEGRRHAFVAFEGGDQASAFMAATRDHGIPCEYAKEDWQTEYKAREDVTSSNVYVVGLPLDWGKDEVEDYMTQFGRVASLRLLEDKEGNRRGPVLVRFDSRPQAERAIKILNGQTHPSTGERLQARIADSDGQKDYKKLRSTSADLILDDRNHTPAAASDNDNVSYLMAIRDKYARRLQMLDAQILAAEQGRDLPTPDYGHDMLPSPQVHGQAWRQRHISGVEAYTPWTGAPPPPTPRQSYPAFAFASQTSSAGSTFDYSPAHSRAHGQRPLYPDLLAPGSLHHARSTPELTSRSGLSSTPKLLWPN